MDVKIRVCLPRKYDRFMLFIDNNFGYEKITIVVDNIPLNSYKHALLTFRTFTVSMFISDPTGCVQLVISLLII